MLHYCILDRNEIWLKELVEEHGIEALVLIDSEKIFELAEATKSDKMRPLKEILMESCVADEVECLLEIRKLRVLAADFAALDKTSLKERRQAGLKIIREMFSREELQVALLNLVRSKEKFGRNVAEFFRDIRLIKPGIFGKVN